METERETAKEQKKIVRLRPACISCLVKQQLDNCPEDVPEAIQREYMQRILKVVAEAPETASAPLLVWQINEIRKRMFGYEQDFTEVKRFFNQLMLEKEEELRKRLAQSEDPLKLALQYAMTGNYIDFGALERVEEEQLTSLLEQAGTNPVDEAEYQALRQELGCARRALYITDNCGEIVLDKLLIQQLRKAFPQVTVTVMVRGGAVLNDATMEDAIQVGLTDIAAVVDNGNNIAGTCLEELSPEAMAALDGADVILAKGQANFETLRKCGRNIYYLFMCKCDLFARGFQVERFTGILVHDRHCV